MKIRSRLLFIAVLWLLPLQCWSSPLLAGGYDAQFQRYWSRYISQHDYQWGVAQCYQESLLEPRAVSHAGAIGLCQFMPKTFNECVKRLNIQNASPYVSELSILCNAWYMGRLLRVWKTERPPLEKLKLAEASYNAGTGNILKAQKASGGELLWKDISPHLYKITGRHSDETLTYIKRIRRWYEEITASNRSTGAVSVGLLATEQCLVDFCCPR